MGVRNSRSLAQLLHTTTGELLGNESKTAGKRGPASRLQQQMEQINLLPKSKQKLISDAGRGDQSEAVRLSFPAY